MKKSQFLPVFEQNFLSENEELLNGVLAGKANLRHVLAFCGNFRRAGIAAMLQTGRGQVFRKRLQRSGAAYAFWLAKAKPEAKQTSASLPFLDALAAGDFGTALEIARLSRHDWAKESEYEEDFLFYEVLMQHGPLEAAQPAVAALLDRWEQCLNGTDDARLEVCRALVARDEKDFGKTLRTYLNERKRAYADEHEGDQESVTTEGSVSVEGVALLRLAKRAGLMVDREYPQAPSPALDDAPMTWPKDSFRDCT